MLRGRLQNSGDSNRRDMLEDRVGVELRPRVRFRTSQTAKLCLNLFTCPGAFEDTASPKAPPGLYRAVLEETVWLLMSAVGARRCGPVSETRGIHRQRDLHAN